MAWKSSFRQNYRTTFLPTIPPSAARISHVVADVEAPGGEKWEHLKSGGKQWQATPKNLPRMQRTRAIPVAWLNSGPCPDRPKGWIPIINNNNNNNNLLQILHSHLHIVISVRKISQKSPKYIARFFICSNVIWGLCLLVRNRWITACFH